ncbi:programmed cell death protein 4-like [Paramacrobiotus metropolitanus]|uniref:programmed cell death protein 4-like n=1 Tax=Paramacrobiotus metropolitanus TaxID=2943436 RepID=UPI0024457665|nr:programmed cell death protein 4-like [Paramacrobiotus metropolitanus]
MSTTAGNSKRTTYSKQKSAEEVEVDELIQQLEVTPTVTPAAAEGTAETVQDETMQTEQQRSTPQKHGKRHLIGKVAAPGVERPGSKPVFVNAKKEAAVTKNSRKPRNGLGRGLPKKGGAGGKGVWGKLGDEMIDYEEEMEQEPGDAIDDYDKMQMQKDEITKPEQLRAALVPILDEYYNHGKSAEFIRSLESRSIKPAIIHMIAYYAVVISMDKKAFEREMTSTLLADLYDHGLTEEHYELAFDQILSELADLVIDCPEALDFTANFIARCIADDCLAPKFIESRMEKHEDKETVTAKTLSKAGVLINIKHGLVRLDNVWGVSGGTRPVKHLIKKMHSILHEYVESSGDVNEALRCLEELQVPHFNHEFVYEAILMVMEDGKNRAFELILKLLKEAAQENILTVDQLNTGFQRIFDDLADIVLDVPSAYSTTEKFIGQCQHDGIISAEMAKKFPARGRKRFVSENDGGRLKDDVLNDEFRQRVESNPTHKEEDEDAEK